ncbi:MAG TPA: CBS domain-containing protein [Thermoplasmata archaeon]|nr:CBS domain-containing protein [Thermoplasmata archaeon]
MESAWPLAREMMTAQPLTLAPDAPLSHALGTMRAKGIHEMPVLKGKRLLGMITFESIARRSNLPLSTKVEHLMVLPPLVSGDTSYPEIAEQLLAAGMRAAPVLGKRGEVVGIISRTDLVRVLPDLPALARHTVEEVATPIALTFRESDEVGKLFGHIRLLEEHPLPVIDRKGKLVGALGIADLGRVLWHPGNKGKRDRRDSRSVFDVEVASIMHSPALTVPRGSTVGDAARLMAAEKVSSVFVVEGGRPVGVVGQTELISLSVGGSEPPGGSRLGDVYVQVHGLRGSGDPSILTEIDALVAKGLKHISRHVRPQLLSLQISPHATHRTGDATVHARLQTDRGIFYATVSGWNFFAGITTLMEELTEQTRRSSDGARRRKRASPRGLGPEADTPADPALEERIRLATGDED